MTPKLTIRTRGYEITTNVQPSGFYEPTTNLWSPKARAAAAAKKKAEHGGGDDDDKDKTSGTPDSNPGAKPIEEFRKEHSLGSAGGTQSKEVKDKGRKGSAKKGLRDAKKKGSQRFVARIDQ